MTDYEKKQLEKYLDQRFEKMEKQYKAKESPKLGNLIKQRT